MTPLKKWKRRILFFILTILFLILGPWILLSSFGYKIDDTFKVVKTGGIYLHSEIPNTNVYLNGKYIKDNGTFLKNVFLQKLKPNTEYKVEVYRDNYNNWVKTIYVYPSLVSEGHVMMLPLEIEQREIYPFFNEQGEGEHSPIPGFTKVSRTLDGRIIPENSEYIKIITLFEGENPYEQNTPEVVESQNVLKKEVKPELPEYYSDLGIKDPELLDNLIETPDEISWLKDGNIVLYWIDNMESIPYYYCAPALGSLDKDEDGQKERLCNNEITLNWDKSIKKFDYYPGRSDIWIVLVDDGIYAVEVDPRSQRNIQPIYLGSGLDFRLDGSGNLIVKDKGSYIELNL